MNWPPSSRSPTRPHQQTSHPAYTIVELLIVIIIISTLAAAALPALSSTLEQMKATALAREIATDMRYAQSLAVNTATPYRISFWQPGQAYAVQRWEDDEWKLCQHPITKKPWQLTTDEHSRYTGLSLKDSQFGPSEYLFWDAFGAPESGGYVTFTLGDATRKIQVAPLSGKITVE